MKKELTLRIVMSAEMVEWGLLALILAVFPASVGSETVTLQTYYPAPYGIYTQMRTMANTTLAEGAGGVGIALGSGVTPGATYKLDVGGATRITSTLKVDTSVGIGMTAGSNVGNGLTPVLSVAGKIAASGYLYSSGPGCAGMGAGGSCPGGYVTFAPGLYVDGKWYQTRAANTRLGWRFWMDDPGVPGSATWLYWSDFMDMTSINAYCCSR